MDIKNIKAIDLHTHFNSGSPDDSPVNDFYQCKVEDIKKEYSASNIEFGAFSSFAAVCAKNDVYGENEKAYTLANENDWFYQWAVIDPFDKRTYAQCKKMYENKKVLGFKIHPVYHGYSLAEFGDEIFKFSAENNAFLLMHPADFELIPSLADKYRECKVIVAHIGSYDHIKCFESAHYDNIYTDTSGGASINNLIIEYAVSKMGAERIFFGTDTYSCAAQRGRIEYAQLSDEDKYKILRGNALREFKNFGI